MTPAQQAVPVEQPAAWGLVCALALERQAVLTLLKNRRRINTSAGMVWEGLWKSKPIRLYQTGIGTEQVRSTLQGLLAKFPVQKLLVCGLSGGLSPEHKTGDVLQVEQVCDEITAEFLKCEPLPDSRNIRRCPLQLTSVRPLSSTDDKQQAAQTFGAELVDMECFAVVRIATELKIPVSVLRVVGDDYQTALLPGVDSLVHFSGEICWSATIAYLLRHPGRRSQLRQLQRQSQFALEQLIKSLKSLDLDQ